MMNNSPSYYKKHVFFCVNQKAEGKQCCANEGGEEFFSYFKAALVKLGIHGPDNIRVSKSGCLGRCALGPCVVIYPEGIWYRYTSFIDLDEIISSHIQQGIIVERLLLPTTEKNC